MKELPQSVKESITLAKELPFDWLVTEVKDCIKSYESTRSPMHKDKMMYWIGILSMRFLVDRKGPKALDDAIENSVSAIMMYNLMKQ